MKKYQIRFFETRAGIDIRFMNYRHGDKLLCEVISTLTHDQFAQKLKDTIKYAVISAAKS